ncbi:hypothetical protein B0T14DRAFT_441225 [Immersiella caudata]|uniref:Uncharacterized protein n=1 Tax=Immersiella caudata TaxID=314043 RepID=A0AA39W4E6_9PEZI|nr:hypothetical protein B0T14DRAFT_441225 [Immersiella caudata]
MGTGAVNRLAPVWPKLRRAVLSRQALVIVIAFGAVWVLCLQLSVFSSWGPPLGFTDIPGLRKGPRRMTSAYNTLPPLTERIACYGPRGYLLSESPDDELREDEFSMPYPMPFTGSHEALGLDVTWMTAEGRYAAYGLGEDKESYNRSKVDWDKVDWGKLQNDCFARNKMRFPSAAKQFDNPLEVLRFGFRNDTHIPEVRHWHDFNQTQRTILVIRAWRGYDYRPEDRHHIRSLITESVLRSGGEYQVVLLVDMRESEENIFSSPEAYRLGLENAGIPPEFRSIAVLWDNHLLESWYPDVPEHRTMWQVYQPMQLFALHYPEFDHFWQLELDMRFTGHAGKFLDRLADFARREPRKQALERSTFMHMQQQIGDYKQFFQTVDRVNNGHSYAWGPVRVPEIQPIGPEPPVRSPKEDDFQWGVGEEADLIVTSYCNNVSAAEKWVFRNWIKGFEAGIKTPRFFCPPAIMRSSRSLLLAIHEAQLDLSLRIPSEATPPSFALWHGLKISFPQHPVYWKVRDDFAIQEQWWKGGPANSSSGMGPDILDHPRGLGLTYWWESGWPRQMYDVWQGIEPEEGVPFPWIMAKQNDKVYMPNMMVHPVKHR